MALTRLVAALVVGVALSLVGPAYAGAQVQVDRLQRTEARLSYRLDRDGGARDPRLTIRRAGVLVVRDASPWGDPMFLATSSGSRYVRVRDLERDGEPEVLVDLYTGGAHCCFEVSIWRWDAHRAAYSTTSFDFGNAGYQLRAFGRRHQLELLSGDDRFAYAFSSYATSPLPVRVLRYRRGRLANVTREHRGLVAADARRQLRRYRAHVQERLDVRGVLAAYQADMALLSRAQEGWRRLERALQHGYLNAPYATEPPYGRQYLRALRRFLRRTGYLR